MCTTRHSAAPVRELFTSSGHAVGSRDAGTSMTIGSYRVRRCIMMGTSSRSQGSQTHPSAWIRGAVCPSAAATTINKPNRRGGIPQSVPLCRTERSGCLRAEDIRQKVVLRKLFAALSVVLTASVCFRFLYSRLHVPTHANTHIVQSMDLYTASRLGLGHTSFSSLTAGLRDAARCLGTDDKREHGVAERCTFVYAVS